MCHPFHDFKRIKKKRLEILKKYGIIYYVAMLKYFERKLLWI